MSKVLACSSKKKIVKIEDKHLSCMDIVDVWFPKTSLLENRTRRSQSNYSIYRVNRIHLNSIEWLNSIDRINQNSIEFTFFFLDWIRLDSITLNYSIDSNEFDYYSIEFDYYSIGFDYYLIEFDHYSIQFD